MRCDRARRALRTLGLALLLFGAAVLAATPPAAAQEKGAGESRDGEAVEEPAEAEDAEEAWDSPEGEIEPAEEETSDDEVEPPDSEPEPEETEEEADEAPGSVDEAEEADEETRWRERHQQMLSAVADAERRSAEAQGQRSMLGDRYSYRGRSRAQILSDVESAGRALEKAQRDLDRFYEEARRADVPPGWVREDD
jgi:hypothetical protein